MIKILIVEDEVIISKDLSNMLIKMGYEVIGDALNYNEAINILEQDKPDLILIDINLNGPKDGIELAEKIKKDYQIPFIFTTSYADSNILDRAKKTKPINYLVKPFTTEQLFTTIELALFQINHFHDSNEVNESPIIIKGALFVKDKYRYSKVNVDDILWIKSDGNYLEIHTEKKCEIIRGTMDFITNSLDDKKFFRTHKSYIVNLDYISKIETNLVTVLSKDIPISKKYHEKLINKLKII